MRQYSKSIFILIFFIACCTNSASEKSADPKGTSQAKGAQAQTPSMWDPSKLKIMGSVLKNTLENYHYKRAALNDDISKKAFDAFIKKTDYGKQFLLASDIKELEQYRNKMDDQVLSGEMDLVNQTMKIMEQRVIDVEKMRDEIFKKGFDFNKDEQIELDPDKREYAKDLEALREVWRKILKQATLRRYVAYLENPEEAEKDDGRSAIENKLIKDFEQKNAKGKASKKKKIEKETPKESLLVRMKAFSDKDKKVFLTKATEAMSKRYKDFIHRIEREKFDDFVENFYNAVAEVYDPHTNYYPPKKKEDFDIEISGSLEGIGAVLSEEGPFIKVVEIVIGGAAWRQKQLSVDDVIMSVKQENGSTVDLLDMRVDEAVRFIRGKKGTIVTLTVKKVDGSKQVIPIKRDVVQIGASFTKSSVLEHKDLPGKKIGYIYVPKFYRDFGDANNRSCSEDVRKEVERLKKSKVDGIILDLRNNGGGALPDAITMSGLFFDEGPVVQVRDQTGNTEVLSDDDGITQFDKPLIVMINRFSASASEIVAAALQDYKRAVIVGGEFSHGKGTVQVVLDLNAGPILAMFAKGLGAFKVTSQKFYRVNGGSTQYKGVTPDVIIPDTFSYGDNREKDLPNSLPWDEVRPLKYQIFTPKYDTSLLAKKSKERVSKSEQFKKISDLVTYLESKKKDTKVPLKLEAMIASDEESNVMAEKLKWEQENDKIKVSSFEASLKDVERVGQSDEKSWQEEFEQRKKDWVSSIRKDAGLEEALFIMNDMMSAGK
jgi:carboxyl-terminal processing protease